MTECAKLTLRTADLKSTYNSTDVNKDSNPYHITPNSSGTIGYTTPFANSGVYPNFVSIDANTNFTWTNINLRSLLGDMYNRYDKFALRIDSIMQGNYNGSDGTATQVGTTYEDTLLTINIAGLPFLNCTYNATTKQTTSIVQLTTYEIFKSKDKIRESYTDIFAVFGKSQETASINIFYTRVCDNQSVLTGGQSIYPDLTFNFTILGIPNKDNTTLTIPSRIDKNTGRL